MNMTKVIVGNAVNAKEFHNKEWDQHQELTPGSCEYNCNCDEQPAHDMTLPLSCYFISAGHNSYLTGNQLSSDSGVEIIIYSLKRSCRVIELDVYNQQPGYSGPVCRHGGTVTQPILFQTCVEAIRDHAFIASPYPVIITIENHTDYANQVLMAGVLTEVLKDMLYIPQPCDNQRPWRSPEQLKGKILIRTNVKENWATEMARLVYIRNSVFKNLQEANGSEKTTSSSFVEDAAAELMKVAFKGSGLKYKASNHNKKDDKPLVSALDALLDITNKAFGKDPTATQAAAAAAQEDEEGISIEAADTVKTLGDAYAYTSRHLMRVYPAGIRVNSSNYNPMRAWSIGASIVALNWQTNDKPLWINQAIFLQQNKGYGYVLKPAWMRTMAGLLGPCSSIPANPLPTPEPQQLRIKLYSAYCKQSKYSFLWLKDDLFVQMYIYGMPIDWQNQRTHTAEDSDKLLLDKEYTFTIHYPELAVLVISLKDEDGPASGNDLLGHWEAPLATLKQGDFVIQLTDSDGRVRPDRWIKLNLKLDKAPCDATTKQAATMNYTSSKTAAAQLNHSTPMQAPEPIRARYTAGKAIVTGNNALSKSAETQPYNLMSMQASEPLRLHHTAGKAVVTGSNSTSRTIEPQPYSSMSLQASEPLRLRYTADHATAQMIGRAVGTSGSPLNKIVETQPYQPMPMQAPEPVWLRRSADHAIAQTNGQAVGTGYHTSNNTTEARSPHCKPVLAMQASESPILRPAAIPTAGLLRNRTRRPSAPAFISTSPSNPPLFGSTDNSYAQPTYSTASTESLFFLSPEEVSATITLTGQHKTKGVDSVKQRW